MRRYVPVLAAVVGLLALPEPATAASYQVRMQQYAFRPAVLTVPAGATVTWTNADQAPHDVVTSSGPVALRSPLLHRGGSWSHRFSTPGTYAYYCSVHPDMRAQVIVRATPTPTPTPAIAHHTKGSATSAHRTPSGTAPPTAMPDGGTQVAQSPGALPGIADAPRKSLNPMLLLVGLVSAIAVFCLLLLTSRRA